MNLLRALLTITLLGSGLAQAGTAVVQFDNPERFTDLEPRRDAQALQQTLTRQLQALATERLPADQTLMVAITDIDLAGEIRPAQHLQGVRVMGRQADWPSITLRYTLQAGERVLAQGSERISDMAYLMRSAHIQRQQPLPYEQRLLSDWFSARFGQPGAH